ncbi:Dipeptidyl-peptidase 5 [Massospora cicadina]|nr:Dipeptidyl-peptidase 5 [Massospora cicadina]
MQFRISDFVALAFTSLTLIQAKLHFTADELVSWPRPSKLTLSPNRTQGLYFTTTYDIETCKTTTRAYVLRFSLEVGSEPTTYDISTLFSTLDSVLTSPPASVWLDSRTLAFVYNHQLWSLPMPDDLQDILRYPSVARPPILVSPLGGLHDVGDLNFHAETGTLIFSARVVQQGRRKGFGDSALVYDKLFVRHWDTFIDPAARRQLFYVGVKGSRRPDQGWHFASEPVNLMRGTDLESPVAPFGGAEDYCLSPDGKELAFVSKAAGNDQAWSTKADVYTVPLDGGRPVRSLTEKSPGASSQPNYSPDGKYIAWLQMKEPQYEADKNRIVLYDRETEKVTELVSWWDRSPSTLEWLGDSKTLFLVAAEYGRSKVFCVSLASNSVRRVTKYDSVSEVKYLRDNVLVASFSSLVAPPEFYTIDVNRYYRMTRQSNINHERLKNYHLSEPEEFWFAGSDGREVHGFLLRPPDFRPWRKYPLAFLIHGGPQSAWADAWSTRWNLNVFASAGYFVVAINPHGSTGYGQNYTDSIRGDWGGRPYNDLMLGLDYVFETYRSIDKKRVCALGASYGGYMINWLNGHTDRFRCLVNHDGMFDAAHAYYTTDELYFNEHDFEGVPWEVPDRYLKFSPASYVWKWSTPTLVIHGAKDYRLVFGEGLATFTALQRRGVPSRLVYFPDENHWVLKPANSLRWHFEVFAWIDRYCHPHRYFASDAPRGGYASTHFNLSIPSPVAAIR